MEVAQKVTGMLPKNEKVASLTVIQLFLNEKKELQITLKVLVWKNITSSVIKEV